MSDQFVAEIRIFSFNFPPTGWAFCDGQLLPISQNTALFSLLGTYYGGNGKSNFALPNMQGKAPMQAGQGQGLTERFQGEEGGSESVTLIQSEMPAHTHQFQASSAVGTTADPTNNVPGKPVWASGNQFGAGIAYTSSAPDQQMHPQALNITGGGLPHNNLQPYLALNFCIAMQGIFPPRS